MTRELSAMEIAVLDLGSTTFHLQHIRADAAGRFSTTLDTKRTPLLGARVFASGTLDRQGWVESLDAVEQLLGASRTCRFDHLVVVATSAIRSAENGLLLVREIERRHDVQVRILDPLEEARLAYLGQTTSPVVGGRRVVAVDLGGGSVEVALGEGVRCLHALSLPIGAVRMRALQDGGLFGREAALTLALRVRERLVPALEAVRNMRPELVTFGSGSARAARALLMRSGPLPGKVGPIDISAWRCRLDEHLGLSSAELVGLGVDPARADSVLASATIMAQILDLLRVTQACVLDKGLRDGIALQVYRELGAGQHSGRRTGSSRSAAPRSSSLQH